ncbi:Nucleoid occlusion protein [Methylobacterium crusticola]|uniref:Nucleoid occlusion protein n=1 Tax=Methylobacterium crusticola TaxID=1697972 RepID=A0ABQ4R7T3_9HYPH|nr:plasmid partitioning protein RepB [Methylobacterium crusticola]GJD53462.1 Nucleoid occlusion protein [Methylobacterium crusticola]
MARKNLLAGLVAPKLPAGNPGDPPGTEAPDPAREAPRTPRYGGFGSRGAIGAVTRSIESLKSAASDAEQIRAQLASGQAVVELDPGLLEPSPVADRIPHQGGDHGDLVESIRRSGQQVPVLVRPHPGQGGRYQIAYGHRRVRAAAEIGRPVRAVVRQLTDAELVVAQGQENNARRDLSFIERALYAARLEEAGFDRETIMAALAVDKTGASRLISAAVKVPRDLIAAIGPAPKVGRDRWITLAAKLEPEGAVAAARAASGSEPFAAAHTDARFEIVLRAVQAPRRGGAAKPEPVVGARGEAIGRLERTPKGARLQIADVAFAEFVAEAMPRLHADWARTGAPRQKGGASR